MDKIVSLCRRRGFVFPSSEIYGGLGSTYDYGHYGVLMKNHIRSLWLRAMVQERDDIVAIDSAVILNPAVWEASGPRRRASATRSIDCRTCKLRFRADRLEDAQCGRKPSKRPGEFSECDLTEPRQFNLMFQTQVGAMEDAIVDARTSAPRRRRASSSTSRTCCSSRGASRRSGSRRSASRSATRSRPATSSSACASSSRWRWSSSCRPPRRSSGTATGSSSGYSWYIEPRHAREHAARARARRERALALLERHERHRVPLPDRLAGARGRREPRRLRPDAAHAGVRHEARVRRPGGRALHAVRHRAGRVDRADLRRDALRRVRRGGRRRARADRAAPASRWSRR